MSFGISHVGSIVINEQHKRQARDVFQFFLTTSLFVTSLTQTAGHKMAALAAVFSRLPNVGF